MFWFISQLILVCAVKVGGKLKYDHVSASLRELKDGKEAREISRQKSPLAFIMYLWPCFSVGTCNSGEAESTAPSYQKPHHIPYGISVSKYKYPL